MIETLDLRGAVLVGFSTGSGEVARYSGRNGTRRLAGAFYVVGLVAIAIAFLVCFVWGLIRGIGALGFAPGAGASLIVATLVLVPIATFIAVVLLRLVIESVVALIAIAENTQQTAAHTDPRSR